MFQKQDDMKTRYLLILHHSLKSLKPFQHGGHFKYFRNDVILTAYDFWKAITSNENW